MDKRPTLRRGFNKKGEEICLCRDDSDTAGTHRYFVWDTVRQVRLGSYTKLRDAEDLFNYTVSYVKG